MLLMKERSNKKDINTNEPQDFPFISGISLNRLEEKMAGLRTSRSTALPLLPFGPGGFGRSWLCGPANRKKH